MLWYKYRAKKKATNYFVKKFSSWWIIQFLRKPWKITENKEETVWCQNQIIIVPSFSHSICL